MDLLTGIAIAFAQSKPSPLPVAYVADNTDLYVVDALTGDILYEATDSPYDCPRSISPDGDWLLRSSGPDASPRNYFLIDLNNGQQIMLPHISIEFIDWQPEGLLYYHGDIYGTAYHYNGTVYRYNRNTQQAQLLMTIPYHPSQVRWRNSPDAFVYAAYSGNELSIYRNGEQTNSLSFPGDNHIYTVVISPDTRFVLIRNGEFGNDTALHVLDTQTGLYETIASIDPLITPQWRPYSNELSYLDSDRNLVIYNPVTQEKQHFELERYGGHPADGDYEWSPNGRYFAYRVYHEGGTQRGSYRLLTLDTVTRETREMARYVSTFLIGMNWVSPTHIVYEYADADYIQTEDGKMRRADADIWLYDASTGEKTQLTDTPDIHETLACIFG